MSLEEWRREQGYAAAHEDADGTLVAVLGTITGGQIVRGDRAGVAERWSYRSLRGAERAWAEWERRAWADEPVGWVRHQPSNRRRHYGEAGTFTQEVRP